MGVKTKEPLLKTRWYLCRPVCATEKHAFVHVLSQVLSYVLLTWIVLQIETAGSDLIFLYLNHFHLNERK